MNKSFNFARLILASLTFMLLCLSIPPATACTHEDPGWNKEICKTNLHAPTPAAICIIMMPSVTDIYHLPASEPQTAKVKISKLQKSNSFATAKTNHKSWHTRSFG